MSSVFDRKNIQNVLILRISIAPNAYIIILYLLCVKCIKSLNNRV